jgi:hypothetical protein
MLGLVVLFAGLSLTGCGGGGSTGSGGTTQPGTSADSYTVTVLGSDSSGKITSSASFTFTVN